MDSRSRHTVAVHASLLVSTGRWECHRDRGRCQHAAGQWGAAESSSSYQSCKSAGVPAGDQPADILADSSHSSGEQRSVNISALYVMVCLWNMCRFFWSQRENDPFLSVGEKPFLMPVLSTICILLTVFFIVTSCGYFGLSRFNQSFVWP